MKLILGTVFFISSTAATFAGTTVVPEIDGLAGMAALGLVGAIATFIWERRRQ